MSAAVIPPALAPRIGQLLRLIGSPVDGEALAACRALGRTLGAAGLSLHELAEAVERPADVTIHPAHEAPRKRREARPGDVVLDRIQRHAVVLAIMRGLGSGRMSAWETEFTTSILAQFRGGRGRLTERQGETLARLLHKLGEGSAWG